MALSYAHSIGDGSNRNFDVPCEYLSKSHVSVRVDGVDVPFVWLDTYRVQTTTPPAAGTVVEVRRTTPRKDRLVVFTDGSTLVQSDLNTSTLQSFFLSQEAFDQGSASMAVTEDGQFSALTRRITSVANPVYPQDAVTRLWAETAMSSQLTAATQKASESLASAERSEASATYSDSRAVAALGYKDEAAASAASAAQSRADAISAKNQTQLDSAATAADRVQTGIDRAAAASSAVAAKQSADSAALFDPSRFLPFYASGAPLPQSNIGPIWHEDFAAIMRWDGTGYASVGIGESRMFTFNTVPAGYLLEDGSAVSRSTYAALFRVIGTTWGAGNGSTTFNLPDSRGEFLRGFDRGRGVDSGRAFTAAQASQNLIHGHTGYTDSQGDHSHGIPSRFTDNSNHRHFNNAGTVAEGIEGGGVGSNANTFNSGNHWHNVTVNNSGGNEARPRNLARLICIKF